MEGTGERVVICDLNQQDRLLNVRCLLNQSQSLFVCRPNTPAGDKEPSHERKCGSDGKRTHLAAFPVNNTSSDFFWKAKRAQRSD
jgi:hypothetical protein